MRRSFEMGLCLSWMLTAVAARADVVNMAPECPAGTERGGGLALGFYGHGGAPPCEPAVCSDARPCAGGLACRRDAHCIAHRELDERPPSVGHRAPPSTDTIRVMRTLDVGTCDAEGECPTGSVCMDLSTCHPAGEADPFAVATSSEGSRLASGAWEWAQPHAGEAGVAPIAPAPDVEASPPATEAAPTPEAPAPIEAPAPATSGLCSATHASSRGWLALVLVALAVGARRHGKGASRSRSSFR